VLVERFWPKDLDKRHAKIDLWLEEVASGTDMRERFGERPDPERWRGFQDLYRNELVDKHKSINLLQKKSEEGVLTLVHRARNPGHSSAAVLAQYLNEETA